ncbi:tetratricopeptide repeat protein [Glaciihabitans tibetensis]|uniref:Tetratricopeptide repeat protein n=1 Tax=Glaciihabitans tibetensis TaxID=1266600 RepID=A0A2T0V9U9_9MICO|nr:tetratricopeptide repeat protein [Glaciihabitans tibetensis]PRY66965.1 tetratricopeptide repeat protein [Glaciihabitans tibetensis]
MTQTLDSDLRTTAGALAMDNLRAQIEGMLRDATARRLPARSESGLIELILLRGHLLGRVSDYEWATALAEQLAVETPDDGNAHLALARTRATLHRFRDALAELEEATRLGGDPREVDGERAVVLQAVGRYDEALAIFISADDLRSDFTSLGNLATVHADRGDTATAEELFAASRERYRGVSPIPVAQLDFKRAHMWIAAGNLGRARAWLESAVRRLPAYAPAVGHLAEVEAALGETDSAIARLLPLATTSDDPDYAAQLAHIFDGRHEREESRYWRNVAAARYDELVERHVEAFADHAAEFWLDAGDLKRALPLAVKNFEVRPTGRAANLVARATR